MFVELTVPLVEHDAVAVRGGIDTLVFYAEHLTRAQRRVLRAHVLAALGDDEPSVTIAVPAGWAAAEVLARRRGHDPLTARAILFSAAAAAVLTVFVAAMIILVGNEQYEDLIVAQAPDSPPGAAEARVPGREGMTEAAAPAPAPANGADPRRPDQPSEEMATAPGAGRAMDLPSRTALERWVAGDRARSGVAPPAPLDLEVVAPEQPQLPQPPAVEPRIPVDPPGSRVTHRPAPERPGVAVRDDPGLEVEDPDVGEVEDPHPDPVGAADRGADDVPNQDGAEDAGADHNTEGTQEGGSGGEEQADGGGAASPGASDVDLAE